jgi:hypothetical protein
MYNFLPRQMQSRHGFEGCLASLDLNGESPDTTLDALVPSPLVVPGCEGEILDPFSDYSFYYLPAQLRSVSMSSPVSKIRINIQNKKRAMPQQSITRS